MMNSKLHLTFMFAMPLIMEFMEGDEQSERDMPKINYHKESLNVYQTLRSTNKNIKYKKICGTNVNLQNILIEGTIALHFAGHGAKNTRFNQQNEGDYLIFENEEDGTPLYLSEMKLK